MVTNREKTLGIIIALGQDSVTALVTNGYERLQNAKILYSISVAARYAKNK